MTHDTPAEKEAAQRVALSLYPKHIRIVRQFAEETIRSDSNAIQYIIEDWARISRLLHTTSLETTRRYEDASHPEALP